MAGHHTFHTPSFGDEEFELPQQIHQNNNTRLIRNDLASVQPASNVAVGGIQSTTTSYGLTNVNSSIEDFVEPTATTTTMNYTSYPQQWSLPNPLDHVVDRTDSLTLDASEFLVQRSQQQQQQQLSQSAIGVDQRVSSSPSAATTIFMQPTATGTGVIDPLAITTANSSDESDDNSGQKATAQLESLADLKNKLKNDPNAPRKPVSAYAMFFGDTQAAIKGQNPDALFAEISKIVESMWDALAPEHKEVYRKKADDAKKEYRRQISVYRSNLLNRLEEHANRKVETGPALQPGATNNVGNTISVSTPNTIGNTTPTGQQSQLIQAANATVQNQNLISTANNLQDPMNHSNNNSIISGQNCIRNGCLNPAIVSPDWEDEYCSNECVVSHCREIFTRWVQDNIATETYATAT